MTKEALKLALEALDFSTSPSPCVEELQDDAIAAIKEALAQPEQECVARVVKHGATVKLEWASSDAAHNAKAGNLYTTPPQRTWVGLTDEEFQMIYDMGRTPAGMMEMVEAKLKEKNSA